MKNHLLSQTAGICLFVIMGVSSISCQSKPAQKTAESSTKTSYTIPRQDSVLAIMLKANQYFMNKWSDVMQETNVRNRRRPSHIWTRGVYYEGLMELHRIHPSKDLYQYAYDWGAGHQWGLHRGPTTRNADNQCCGQTYIELYKMCPDPAMIKDIKACMDMLVNTPQNNDWTWIDAIQMGMPILAQMGSLTGDSRYYEKAYQMYLHTRNIEGGKGLWNPQDGLWWRDASFCPPYKEPNGEDCYWSRGNGWVYVALTRYMSLAPEDPHCSLYKEDFQRMSAAILACQREDGFWNVSLHDPDHFGGKETSGTSLFVCGMLWGVRKGLLPADTYLPAAIKGWKALETCVHPNGFLGYVQGTGKEPKDGQPVGYNNEPDFDDYGLGCFLMAGCEVYKITAR